MNKLSLMLITAFTAMFVSCGSIVNSIHKSKFNHAIKVEVSNYDEINLDDKFSVAAAGANIRLGNLSAPIAEIGIGVDLQHYSSNYGAIALHYNYPIKFTSPGGSNYFLSENKVTRHEFNLKYCFPVYKFVSHQERYIAGIDRTTDKNYVVKTETAIINQFDLRLSLGSDFNRSLRSGYKSLINENFSTFNFTDQKKDLAEINQNTTFLSFGVGYKNLIKTSLDAKTKKGEVINAFSGIITNLYFDVNVLVSNSIDNVEFSYYASKSFEPTEFYSEIVTPTDYLERVPLGFTLGYQAIVAGALKPKIPNIITIEIGTIPGYYNKPINALIFTMGFKYGIGKWH